MAVDIFTLNDLRPDFGFFFDRGCYHIVRQINVRRYVEAIKSWTLPGAMGLVLTGNAREEMKPGPPVVTEEEFRKAAADFLVALSGSPIGAELHLALAEVYDRLGLTGLRDDQLRLAEEKAPKKTTGKR